MSGGSRAVDAATLADAAAALGLTLTDEALQRLCAFGELLLKWNRVYNLTAIRNPAEVLTHHLLDSLAVLPKLDSVTRLADVGSGAGLPGAVLAIARADLQVSSVEAVNKKASFQQQLKIELQLDNFIVFNRRVEQLKAAELPGGGADGVISRAFSSVGSFVAVAGHLLAPGGALYAMKGGYPHAELAELPAGWKEDAVHVLHVPGLDAERHLLVLRRSGGSGPDGR